MRSEQFQRYFKQWIQAQYAAGKVSENSERVYRSMWARFAACMHDDPLSASLETLTAAVEQCTAGSHTSYPKRMAQLVSKVLVHAAAVAAETELRKVSIDASKALPMRFRDSRRKDPVISSLSASTIVTPAIKEAEIHPSDGWKYARDIAIASLNVHCGLKMEEIIALNYDDVVDSRKDIYAIHSGGGDLIGTYIVRCRGGRPRQITMPAYAAIYIEAWLSHWSNVAARPPRPGDPLLIGRPILDQSRKPTGAITRISRLTVYRAIKAAMNNISSNQGRNGFIYRQISAGIPPEVVSEWAGFRNYLSIQRHANIAPVKPGAKDKVAKNADSKAGIQQPDSRAGKKPSRKSSRQITRQLARSIPVV